MQAPSCPTFNWLKRTLPLSHSSKTDMPKWSLLKVATTFWHIGGGIDRWLRPGDLCSPRGVLFHVYLEGILGISLWKYHVRAHVAFPWSF